MKREILEQALNEISDRHIAEAAGKKKRMPVSWIGSVAAALAVVILCISILRPISNVKAISEAEYPEYQWEYRSEEMKQELPKLTNFFTQSIAQTLSDSDENQAYSPINLYMALCLMAETCNSNEQILALLNADSKESMREQANLIWNATYNDQGDKTLLANSVWLDEGLNYNKHVMDTLASSYYASVYEADLQSLETANAVKNWLNGQTHDLLDSDVRQLYTDDQAVLQLYSTVYYQAKWPKWEDFDKGMNTEGKFHTPYGDVDCTYMNKKELQTAYFWGEDFGAINLGLNDGSRLWLLLPDTGKTTDDILASPELASLVFHISTYEYEYENSKYMKVNLSLPKFDIHASGDLKESLQAMGITDIFSPATADLSGTLYGYTGFGDFSPYISAVNQATRVAVDEDGVTAASYIQEPTYGAPIPPDEIIDFVLDRPFVFVITNRYALPLFAGVVNEP